jgi:hypothetical protein
VRALIDQPLLLDRIRAVTVSNNPGQLIRIRDRFGNRATVQWIEFITEYIDAGWVEA